jgi:hypothetical protein
MRNVDALKDSEAGFSFPLYVAEKAIHLYSVAYQFYTYRPLITKVLQSIWDSFNEILPNLAFWYINYFYVLQMKSKSHLAAAGIKI